MSSVGVSSSLRAPSGFASVFKTFAEEATVLLQAMLNPGKVIAEVERMRALQLEADRIEATDPLRATMLRRRAANILS